MELINVKLHNGFDIVAQNVSTNDETYLGLYLPLHIEVSSEGVYIESWNLMMEGDVAVVHKKDALFWGRASAKAKEYYLEFFQQMGGTPSDQQTYH